jgi:hypothetical protein
MALLQLAEQAVEEPETLLEAAVEELIEQELQA